MPIRAPAQVQASLVDPESIALLRRMAEAYRGAARFSCTIVARANAGGREEFAQATLKLRRPSQVALVVGEGERARSVVANGTDRRTVREGRTQWARGVRPDRAISDALAGSEFFVSPVFPLLLGASDAAERLLPGKAVRVGRGNDEILDGIPVDVVVADIESPTGSARLSFAIGREDHFLRRLRITARRAGSTMDLSEVFTDINVDGAIDPATFRMEPPGKTSPPPRPLKVPPPKGRTR